MSGYWSQYWKQGHITSFGHDIVGNYKGALREFWESSFAQSKEKSRVLDIGTGNGALIDIALACRGDLDLTGVDYAQLKVPNHLLNLDNVKFLELVNAEKLPMQDEQYELVVSQFGIEYADLDLALTQMYRVLCKDGRFHLVMHDASSIIVQPNIKILEAAKSLKKADGVLEVLSFLIEVLEVNGQHSQQSEQLRQTLNKSIANIAESNQAGLVGTYFLQFLRHVFSVDKSLTQRKQSLTNFTLELNGQITRLSELKSAALDESRHQLVKNRLHNLGLNILNDSLLVENGAPLARIISGQK